MGLRFFSTEATALNFTILISASFFHNRGTQTNRCTKKSYAVIDDKHSIHGAYDGSIIKGLLGCGAHFGGANLAQFTAKVHYRLGVAGRNQGGPWDDRPRDNVLILVMKKCPS